MWAEEYNFRLLRQDLDLLHAAVRDAQSAIVRSRTLVEESRPLFELADKLDTPVFGCFHERGSYRTSFRD